MPGGQGDARMERATVGDMFAAGLFAALVLPFATAPLTAASDPRSLPGLAAAAVLGVLAADFATGFVHWLCDTFFAEDTPIVGRAVIEPFREHHRDPLALTRRTFLRVSNSNILATCVVLALVTAHRVLRPAPASVFADTWLVTFACAVMLTNQFHKWAHQPRVSRPVAWLQTVGVILNPARHGRHHDARDGRAFCVTTGWMNPLVDGVRLFAALERLVAAAKRTFVPGRAS